MRHHASPAHWSQTKVSGPDRGPKWARSKKTKTRVNDTKSHETKHLGAHTIHPMWWLTHRARSGPIGARPGQAPGRTSCSMPFLGKAALRPRYHSKDQCVKNNMLMNIVPRSSSSSSSSSQRLQTMYLPILSITLTQTYTRYCHCCWVTIRLVNLYGLARLLHKKINTIQKAGYIRRVHRLEHAFNGGTRHKQLREHQVEQIRFPSMPAQTKLHPYDHYLQRQQRTPKQNRRRTLSQGF